MKTAKGFNLIEIMLVLAIASAIIFMVFAGVGSVKRNSRDSERMSERDLIATSFKSYASAHDGLLPEVGLGKAILVDGGTNQLQTNSPLITGGYLNDQKAYEDPLSSTSYRIIYSKSNTDPKTVDCNSASGGPSDANSATLLYEISEYPDPDPLNVGVWKLGKSFKLGICLEGGNLNNRDFGM